MAILTQNIYLLSVSLVLLPLPDVCIGLPASTDSKWSTKNAGTSGGENITHTSLGKPHSIVRRFIFGSRIPAGLTNIRGSPFAPRPAPITQKPTTKQMFDIEEPVANLPFGIELKTTPKPSFGIFSNNNVKSGPFPPSPFAKVGADMYPFGVPAPAINRNFPKPTPEPSSIGEPFGPVPDFLKPKPTTARPIENSFNFNVPKPYPPPSVASGVIPKPVYGIITSKKPSPSTQPVSDANPNPYSEDVYPDYYYLDTKKSVAPAFKQAPLDSRNGEEYSQRFDQIARNASTNILQKHSVPKLGSHEEKATFDDNKRLCEESLSKPFYNKRGIRINNEDKMLTTRKLTVKSIVNKIPKQNYSHDTNSTEKVTLATAFTKSVTDAKYSPNYIQNKPFQSDLKELGGLDSGTNDTTRNEFYERAVLTTPPSPSNTNNDTQEHRMSSGEGTLGDSLNEVALLKGANPTRNTHTGSNQPILMTGQGHSTDQMNLSTVFPARPTPHSIERRVFIARGRMRMKTTTFSLLLLFAALAKPAPTSSTKPPTKSELPFPCTSSPCQNGGVCQHERKGEFSCACANEYHGPVCEWVMPRCTESCEKIVGCVSYPHEAICLCNDRLHFCRIDIGEPTQEEKLRAEIKRRHGLLGAFVGIVSLLLVTTLVHCCRVFLKRDELREKYKQCLKKGTLPEELPPDFVTIWMSLCLCRGLDLDKKVEPPPPPPTSAEVEKKPRKSKKKKKKSKRESRRKKKSRRRDNSSDDNRSSNCYRRKPATPRSRSEHGNSDGENTNAHSTDRSEPTRLGNHTSTQRTKSRTKAFARNQADFPRRKTKNRFQEDLDYEQNDKIIWDNYDRALFDTMLERKSTIGTDSCGVTDQGYYHKNKILYLSDHDCSITTNQNYPTRESGGVYKRGTRKDSTLAAIEELAKRKRKNSFVAKHKEMTGVGRDLTKPAHWARHFYDPTAIMNLVWSDENNSETDSNSEETIYEMSQY